MRNFGKSCICLNHVHPFSSISCIFLRVTITASHNTWLSSMARGPRGPSIAQFTSFQDIGNLLWKWFEDMFEVSTNAHCLPRAWRTPTWHKTLLPFHPISQCLNIYIIYIICISIYSIYFILLYSIYVEYRYYMHIYIYITMSVYIVV